MTITELAKEMNLTADTVRRKFRAANGRTYSIHETLTDAEIMKFRTSANPSRPVREKSAPLESAPLESAPRPSRAVNPSPAPNAETETRANAFEIDELAGINLLFIAAGIFSMSYSLGVFGFVISLAMSAFPFWAVRMAGNLDKGESFNWAFAASILVELFFALFHNQNLMTLLEDARFVPFGRFYFSLALSVFIWSASWLSLKIRRRAAIEKTLSAAGLQVF
jgi:hypothetical protein